MRANGEDQTIPKSVGNSLYNSVTSCMSIYVSELFKWWMSYVAITVYVMSPC